jgi:hypothetical protein
MCADSSELYSSAANAFFAAPTGKPDRRTRTRTKVRWQLALYRDQSSAAVQTETEDLSSRGFYFVSRIPFLRGESLIGRLSIPAHDPSGREHSLMLECRVRVVRAEGVGDGGLFGVGCQIDEYHLVPAESSLSKELA